MCVCVVCVCVFTLSGLLEWPACVSRELQPRREARFGRLCVPTYVYVTSELQNRKLSKKKKVFKIIFEHKLFKKITQEGSRTAIIKKNLKLFSILSKGH